MSYWKLVCEDCKEALPSIVATSPGEMLNPHTVEDCPCCGAVDGRQDSLVDSVRLFHARHRGHALDAAELDAETVVARC